MIHVEAILRGGPADGRLMVVRDLREVLVKQVDPAWVYGPLMGLGDAEFPTVPTKTYRYEPVRVLAEFEVGGVS